MRLTRKVFVDLAIWMVAFGLAMGIVFPLPMIAVGVPRRIAMAPLFLGSCLAAGAVVGLMNYCLARVIVGARLRLLARGMHVVEDNIAGMAFKRDLSQCTPERCSIAVDSEDEIGESAAAFNHLAEALAKSMKAQVAVREFSEMLTSQLELEELADNALLEFFRYTGAAGGMVLYQSAGELEVAASRGLRDPKKVAESERVALAIRSGERQVVSIPADVTVEGVVADFRPLQVAVFPVIHEQVVLGVLVLATARPFDADQWALIDSFLQGLELALNNALAHERLQRLAALDPLTEAYNRRFGLRRFHEEFSRAVRGDTCLAVLMLDVDRFKAVNDTYGHLAGDRVLKQVSAKVRGSLREGDVLLRYGGEEFLAILPGASTEDLRCVGERIRKAVGEIALHEGQATIQVTVSVGGVVYCDHGLENEEAMIQMADEAVYRAKHLGRDRLEIAL